MYCPSQAVKVLANAISRARHRFRIVIKSHRPHQLTETNAKRAFLTFCHRFIYFAQHDGAMPLRRYLLISQYSRQGPANPGDTWKLGDFSSTCGGRYRSIFWLLEHRFAFTPLWRVTENSNLLFIVPSAAFGLSEAVFGEKVLRRDCGASGSRRINGLRKDGRRVCGFDEWDGCVPLAVRAVVNTDCNMIDERSEERRETCV